MDDEDMEIPLPPGDESGLLATKSNEETVISVLSTVDSGCNLPVSTSTKPESSKIRERSSPSRKTRDESSRSRCRSSQTRSTRTEDSSRFQRLASPRTSHGGSKSSKLKYTYIAVGLDNKEKSYPMSVIKYTKALPSLAYCCNVRYETGVYDSRLKLLSSADSVVKEIMETLMNGRLAGVKVGESTGPTEKQEEPKLRGWYSEKIIPVTTTASIVKPTNTEAQELVLDEEKKPEGGLVEKYDEFLKSLDPPVPEESSQKSQAQDEVQRYSPNWNSDSEDETQLPQPAPPAEKPVEKPATAAVVPKIGLKLVPKSRIKIDLQIFADEDKPEEEAEKPEMPKNPDKPTSKKDSDLPLEAPKQTESSDKPVDKETKEENETKKMKREEEEPTKARRTSTDKKTTKETKERERKSPEIRKERRRTDERRSEARREPAKSESRKRETTQDSRSRTDRRSRDKERGSRERSRIEPHSKGESARRSRSPKKTDKKSPHSKSDSQRSTEKRKRSPVSERIETKRRRSGSHETSKKKPQENEVPLEILPDALAADQTGTPSAGEEAEKKTDPPPTEEPDEQKADPGESEESIAQRISLDERLERELGIKPPVAEPSQESVSIDCYQFAFLTEKELENYYPTRRRGFGPKAAPMGSLVYSCPAIFPFRPYVPPHVEVLLFQRPAPLVQRAAPAEPMVPAAAAADEVTQESKETEATVPKENGNDWDGKLRLLEEAANNLESGDETVLEDIEEKLLLFEAMSIVPRKEDSPPAPVRPKQKRSKPKPITLKPAEKGILIMPRFTLNDKTTTTKQRSVMFADNVRPGDGTSSSGGEELYSPPPPIEAAQEKPRKRRKKKKMIQEEGDDLSDSEFDKLPPPPPPPGSPPPHLLRYKQPVQAELVEEQLQSGESPPPPPPGED